MTALPAADAWMHATDAAPAVPARGATPSRWVQRRNCSLTPAQLFGFYGAACAVAALLAAGFWWFGAPWVSAFAGLEMLAVGGALLVHARHTGDGETLSIEGHELVVEQREGARLTRHRLAAGAVRVQLPPGRGALLELRAGPTRLAIGRHLRPEARARFAAELRGALRHAAARAAASN
jgi:uncharacterized membrane protein